MRDITNICNQTKGAYGGRVRKGYTYTTIDNTMMNLADIKPEPLDVKQELNPDSTTGNTPKKKPGRPKGSLGKKKQQQPASNQPMITDHITVVKKEKRKHDRFKGMPESEVLLRLLPDRLTPDLDIVIVGINPGLYAAFVGHHYAGPGNHFWKCMFLSGLIPEQMTAMQDEELLKYGIGFTNIVARTSRGSADLTRKEIKEGAEILTEKLLKYKPKIAVFNGKGIYEVFVGHKNFYFGKQPDPLPGTNTAVYVMPSSSARCSQLPRAIDKVPFYNALRKFRDHLCGKLPDLDDSEITFPDLELKTAKKEPKEEVKEEFPEENSGQYGGDPGQYGGDPGLEQFAAGQYQFIPHSQQQSTYQQDPHMNNMYSSQGYPQVKQEPGTDHQMQGMHSQMQGMHPHMQGMHPQMQDMNHQMQGMNPQMQGMHPQMQGMHPQMQGMHPQMQGMHPQMYGNVSQMQGNGHQMQGNNPQMQGNDSQMHGNNHSMQGNNPQIQGNDHQMQGNYPQMQGNDSQMHGNNHSMQGNNPQMQGNSNQMQGNDHQMHESNHSKQGNEPPVHGSNSQMQDNGPQMQGSSPKLQENNPQKQGNQSQMQDSGREMQSSSPHMLGNNPQTQGNSPQMRDSSPHEQTSKSQTQDSSPQRQSASPQTQDSRSKVPDSSPKVENSSPQMPPLLQMVRVKQEPGLEPSSSCPSQTSCAGPAHSQASSSGQAHSQTNLSYQSQQAHGYTSPQQPPTSYPSSNGDSFMNGLNGLVEKFGNPSQYGVIQQKSQDGKRPIQFNDALCDILTEGNTFEFIPETSAQQQKPPQTDKKSKSQKRKSVDTSPPPQSLSRPTSVGSNSQSSSTPPQSGADLSHPQPPTTSLPITQPLPVNPHPAFTQGSYPMFPPSSMPGHPSFYPPPGSQAAGQPGPGFQPPATQPSSYAQMMNVSMPSMSYGPGGLGGPPGPYPSPGYMPHPGMQMMYPAYPGQFPPGQFPGGQMQGSYMGGQSQYTGPMAPQAVNVKQEKPDD